MPAVPRIVVALASTLAVAAPACRRAPPAPRTIVIAQMHTAGTFDPHGQDDDYTIQALAHFYEALVAFGPDMQIVPALAASWDNPTDNTWRFHLRRGVVFHDGRPLAAADVVASLERARRAPHSRVRYYLQAVASVRAIDDATVEVTTSHPAPVLLGKLAFVAVVPRDVGLEPIARPVGTGPYRFVSGTLGAEIVGERFTRTWRERPAFDRVRLLALPDAGERADAVASGRADLVGDFPADRWEWGQSQRGMRTMAREGLSVSFLSFDRRRPSPFADVRVRRACELALDRGALAARGLRNMARPAGQVVPPAIFGYAADLEPTAADPAAARRLLADAGFPRGLDVELVLPESLGRLGNEAVRQLATAGVRARAVPLPWPAFSERWYQTGIPLALSFPWIAGSGDATDILDDLLHSPAAGYGGSNRLGYANPTLDGLIEEAGRTLDAQRRRRLLAAAMAVIREDAPVVPLLVHFDLYAARADLDWTPRLDHALRAYDVQGAPQR